MSASNVRAGRAFVEVGTNNNPLYAGLKAAEARLRGFGRVVGSIGSGLKNVGGAAAGLGTKLAGFAALATAPLVAATKATADFEQQMARVGAVLTEAGAGAADIAALNEEAKRLGRDTVFSAAQAAEAMSNFATAGFNAGQIMKATGPALDLAATAQIGIADAAKIAANVMKGMQIDAEGLTHVIDVMAKAYVTAGNTDIPLLGDAFAKVGPLAKTAGIRFEELAAAIQIVSDQGIAGEEAGTSLRGVIATLTSPAEKGAKALDELGVRVNDAKGNFRGIAPIIADFERALGGMGSGEKLQRLGDIFDTKQISTAALLLNRGSAALSDATAKLNDSSGVAARIAAKQLDTLQGAWKLFTSSVEGVAIEIGAALTPTLRAIGEQLVRSTNGIAAFVKENKELVVAVAKGVVVAGTLGAGLVVIGSIASGLGSILITVGGAIGLVAAAIGALATPLGAAVAAAVAASYAWLAYTASGKAAVAELGGIFSAMKADGVAAVGGIIEAMKAGDLAKAWEVTGALLRVEWLRTTGYFFEKWVGLKTMLEDAWDNLGGTLAAAIGGAWELIRAEFASTLRLMTTDFGGFVTGLLKVLAPAAGALGAAMGVDLKRMVDAGLKGVGNRLGSVIGKAPEKPAGPDVEQRRDARHTAADVEVQNSRIELRDAEDELKGLLGGGIGAAAGAAAAEGGGTASGAVGAAGAGAAGRIRQIGPALDTRGIGRGLSRAKANVEAAGTFSSAALFGMGTGGSLPQRQLDEAKESKKILQSIDGRLRKAGPLVANEP